MELLGCRVHILPVHKRSTPVETCQRRPWRFVVRDVLSQEGGSLPAAMPDELPRLWRCNPAACLLDVLETYGVDVRGRLGSDCCFSKAGAWVEQAIEYQNLHDVTTSSPPPTQPLGRSPSYRHEQRLCRSASACVCTAPDVVETRAGGRRQEAGWCSAGTGPLRMQLRESARHPASCIPHPVCDSIRSTANGQRSTANGATSASHTSVACTCLSRRDLATSVRLRSLETRI